MGRTGEQRANGAGSEAGAGSGPGSTNGLGAGTAPANGNGFSSSSDSTPPVLQNISQKVEDSEVLGRGSETASHNGHHDSSGSSPNGVTARRPKTPELHPVEDTTATTPPSTSLTPFPSDTTQTPHRRKPVTNHHHHSSNSSSHSSKKKFTTPVFTHAFSTFDRQNPHAANSPFHGFFTLFWMAVFLFVVKIAADNWRRHGSILGTNEIMRGMFGCKTEVLVLLVADGVMCGITGVGWVVQRVVGGGGWVDWDGGGWVLQNIWQTAFIGGVVGFTRLRDWPWTHTVFFVLHGLVMLMKQHSYAFYNGHLSSVYKQRQRLLRKLKELERISPVTSPSTTGPPAGAIDTAHLAKAPSARERRQSLPHENILDVGRIVAAIDSREPLDGEQVHVFERVLKWEVDALSDELRGKSTKPGREYPNNLTLCNHYEYIVLPTVVYELEYPRSDSINWYYAAEKAAACFGIIFVMIMISQAFIYPVVMTTVRMKEEGVPLAGRFREFPWMLLDLVFPFLMEYLLTWYLIWETILNFLAELTYFADRSFYDAWWNCVSWDQFARDWNRPVHNFLLRHVYHSSISAMKVDKHTATLITFFLSACVHELVMWCIFKKLRGYLLILQMCQLPLVRLSRTKWLRNRATLGNVIFWLGIFTGPSVLCSLYLIL